MNRKNDNIFNEDRYYDILRHDSIITLFHPIVSVKKNKIIGFEALSRGVTENGSIVGPQDLFEMSRHTGTSVELDRLCRQKALESFLPIYNENSEYLLSINVDSSVLCVTRGSNHLYNSVKEMRLDPSSIIIEILESDVQDPDALNDFVERYRSNNFLIAIDDIGSGFSNLERVTRLKPDVIKIDRSLVTGIADNFTGRRL